MSSSIKLNVVQCPARQTNTDFRILIPWPRISLHLYCPQIELARNSYFTGFCYGNSPRISWRVSSFQAKLGHLIYIVNHFAMDKSTKMQLKKHKFFRVMNYRKCHAVYFDQKWCVLLKIILLFSEKGKQCVVDNIGVIITYNSEQTLHKYHWLKMQLGLRFLPFGFIRWLALERQESLSTHEWSEDFWYLYPIFLLVVL